jgi:hypothetical protein
LLPTLKKDVDARDKRGHDEGECDTSCDPSHALPSPYYAG